MELIMTTDDQQQFQRYLEAQKQVKELKGFYAHLLSFLMVMAFLIFINLTYTPKYLWFFWPFLGWGIGLLFHGLKAFNWFPFLSKEWEERKIKQFMEEEEKHKNKFQ